MHSQNKDVLYVRPLFIHQTHTGSICSQKIQVFIKWNIKRFRKMYSIYLRLCQSHNLLQLNVSGNC